MNKPINQHHWELWLKVAQKRPIDRNASDEEELMKLLASIRFFYENLELKMSPEDFFSIAHKYLKYERFERESFVYHDGQPADKLYIILKGAAKEYEARPLNEIESEVIKLTEESPRLVKAELEEDQREFYKIKALQVRSRNLNTIPVALKKKLTSRFGKAAHASLIGKLKAMNSSKILSRHSSSDELGSVILSNKPSIAESPALNKKKNDRKAKIPKELNAITQIIQKAKEAHDYQLFGAQTEYQKQYFYRNVFKYRVTKTLKTGEILGEQALRSYKPRNATCVAAEDLHTVSLSKDDFIRAATELLESMKGKADYFKELLSRHNQEEVEKLSYYFSEVKMHNKSLVYKQGEEPDAFYFIRSGSITLAREPVIPHVGAKLIRNKSEDKNCSQARSRLNKSCHNLLPIKKQPISVLNLTQGQFFGEELILSANRRVFTAISDSHNTLVYRLSHFSYRKIMSQFSQIFESLRTLSRTKYTWRSGRIKELFETEADREERARLVLEFSTAKMLSEKLMVVQVPLDIARNMPIMQVSPKRVRQRHLEEDVDLKRKYGKQTQQATFQTAVPKETESVDLQKLHDSYKSRFHRETYDETLLVKRTIAKVKPSRIENTEKNFQALFPKQKSKPLESKMLTSSNPKIQILQYEMNTETLTLNNSDRELTPTNQATEGSRCYLSPQLDESHISNRASNLDSETHSTRRIDSFPSRNSISPSTNALHPTSIPDDGYDAKRVNASSLEFQKFGSASKLSQDYKLYSKNNGPQGRKKSSSIDRITTISKDSIHKRSSSQAQMPTEWDLDAPVPLTAYSGLTKNPKNIKTQLRSILNSLDINPNKLTSLHRRDTINYILAPSSHLPSISTLKTHSPCNSLINLKSHHRKYSKLGSLNVPSAHDNMQPRKPNFSAIHHAQSLHKEMNQVLKVLSPNEFEAGYNLKGKKFFLENEK